MKKEKEGRPPMEKGRGGPEEKKNRDARKKTQRRKFCRFHLLNPRGTAGTLGRRRKKLERRNHERRQKVGEGWENSISGRKRRNLAPVREEIGQGAAKQKLVKGGGGGRNKRCSNARAKGQQGVVLYETQEKRRNESQNTYHMSNRRRAKNEENIVT